MPINPQHLLDQAKRLIGTAHRACVPDLFLMGAVDKMEGESKTADKPSPTALGAKNHSSAEVRCLSIFISQMSAPRPK